MWASEMVTGDRPFWLAHCVRAIKDQVQSLGLMLPVHLHGKAYSVCLILAGMPFSKSVSCTCETLIRKDVSLPPSSRSGEESVEVKATGAIGVPL